MCVEVEIRTKPTYGGFTAEILETNAFNSPYYVYVVRLCYGHVSRTNVQPL
jgi:hypothetical protein